MRFWPKKGNRVLVVGIFQSAGAGRAVLQNLHRARFRRAAAIHASAKGRPRIEEQGISAIGGSAAALIVSVVLGALIFWACGMLGDDRPAWVALGARCVRVRRRDHRLDSRQIASRACRFGELRQIHEHDPAE